MKKYIGTRRYVSAPEMKETYMSLGRNDENAAILLAQQRLYNEAVYMHIQAMEKKIKGYICGKINVSNPYFSKKLRDIGHSLDVSIDFLIEILGGNNDALKSQLSVQLKSGVFENIRFSNLYNASRYPCYDSNGKRYSVLEIGKEDYLKIANIGKKLDKFIEDFDRL